MKRIYIKQHQSKGHPAERCAKKHGEEVLTKGHRNKRKLSSWSSLYCMGNGGVWQGYQ